MEHVSKQDWWELIYRLVDRFAEGQIPMMFDDLTGIFLYGIDAEMEELQLLVGTDYYYATYQLLMKEYSVQTVNEETCVRYQFVDQGRKVDIRFEKRIGEWGKWQHRVCLEREGRQLWTWALPQQRRWMKADDPLTFQVDAYLDQTIQITEVTEGEKEILRNFLALYLHDLSPYSTDLQPNEQGLYEYDAFDLFFEKETLTPLLFKIDGQYAGFIMLTQPPYAPKDVDYCINEFFILRSYRRKRWAQQVVQKLFRIYPGRYYIVQLMENAPAVSFWRRLYRDGGFEYEQEQQSYDGSECIAQKVMTVKG